MDEEVLEFQHRIRETGEESELSHENVSVEIDHLVIVFFTDLNLFFRTVQVVLLLLLLALEDYLETLLFVIENFHPL